MENWHRISERLIEEAQEKGDLDVPAMHGKPLDLTENPYVPEDQRLAFKLLKDNDLSPAWIIDGKEIRELIDTVLATLRRSHARFEQTMRRLEGRLDVDAIYERDAAYRTWDSARERFRQSAGKINKLTETYNLRVPISSLQRLYFNAERELDRLDSDSGRR
jgi:Domain of unknown function (DUF1992)